MNFDDAYFVQQKELCNFPVGNTRLERQKHKQLIWAELGRA